MMHGMLGSKLGPQNSSNLGERYLYKCVQKLVDVVNQLEYKEKENPHTLSVTAGYQHL